MGLKELEIDFSKSKHNIVLFVGDNGSGKTSLLSSLHPFAYNGSMDPRNSTSILREDKDGYKEIHIDYNGDVYKIQHHYKNTKRGIILKSFIQKNGEELNPNGNVTSFNETIKNELSLELDFLRLLRLGSNVTNLIDMKAAERKSFTSYLLTDISMYNELFRKVSEDNRILRNMIRTVSDKLVKLNVLDEAGLQSEIDDVTAQLNTLTETKDNLQHSLGIVEGKISELAPNGIDSIESSIESITTSIASETGLLQSIQRKMSKLCVVLVYDFDTEISLLTKRLNAKTGEKDLKLNMILFYNEQLSGLLNKKTELENTLKVTVSNETLSEMTTLYANIVAKVDACKQKYNDYTPVYTRDNMMTLLEVLKQIDSIVHETYGFSRKAMLKVIQLIKSSNSVPAYIANRHKEIERDMVKVYTELKGKVTPNDVIVLFRPEHCRDNTCPYLALGEMLFSTDKKSDGKSIASLENEKELLDDMSAVNTNIDYIFMILKTNESLISRGDIPYFRINNILDCMMKGSTVFDEDYITDMISEVEEYEEYIQLQIKARELKAELTLMQSNDTVIKSTKKELSAIDAEISDLYGKIHVLERENDQLDSSIDSIRRTIETLTRYCEYSSAIDVCKSNIAALNDDRKKKEDELGRASSLRAQSMSLKQRLDQIVWEINKRNAELFTLRVKLRDFKSLSEEQATLNAKYDDVSIIRESLSSTKGIPLLYMQLYLKNIKLFVNELLRIVYDDNFEIDDFDINETEFNIPYIKNNIRISDVMYASQGERSFLSLALSFALINQSIKDYNILLLDEIDSTLDTRNRAMFLNILEKQMDRINSEQVFLITHNNVFENFPVDLIVTTKNKDINYSNANVIWTV